MKFTIKIFSGPDKPANPGWTPPTAETIREKGTLFATVSAPNARIAVQRAGVRYREWLLKGIKVGVAHQTYSVPGASNPDEFVLVEELCEVHPICEEARESLGYAQYRVYETASGEVLSLDLISTLMEAQKVADEIESEDREVVIQVRQGNEWVKVEG